MAEQEILAPGALINTRPVGAAPIGFGRHLDRLSGFTQQPAVRRALPTIGVVGSLALAATAYWSLQTAPQMPLFQGLTDSDKSAVADALQSSGIAYTIDTATGSVQVNADEVHKARIVLAGQGLPKAAPAGDTVIASLPMGSSRAVEGETLRAAREADLARTIEAIDTVKTARIHLATPEQSVFVRDSVAPAASVMLTLQTGRTLSQAQVRAIRHLVASSVSGMAPEQVSIVDQSGALLSQDDASGDDANFRLQVQMEDRYRQAIDAMLSPILGRGNYTVEVHADVDASESQSTRETFPKDDRALRREEGNSATENSSAPSAIGIPGALSNQPPPASQLSTTPPPTSPPPATQTGGQSAQTYARSFDVGREISVTHKPQGYLSRLSVAVALRDPKTGKPRSTAEINAFENLVKGAVGFDAARGDVVAISSRRFVDTPETVTRFWNEAWFMPLLRQVGAVIGALFVLLFIGRPVIKMLRSKAEASASLTEALEQQLLGATSGGPGALSAKHVTLDMIEAAPSYEARANLVRAFVRQDSERAALVVKQLMAEAQDDR
jgi:flagellar M-ring protein FliF